MQSDWAARRYPGRLFQGGQKIARATRRPTPSRARRTPRGAAATSLTLRAPGLVGTGRPRTAPAAAGRHQGPTQRLPGPRRQARPTYLQRLLLRPRPEPPPWWSPGPAFSRPPSLWRPTALVRAGEAGERASRGEARASRSAAASRLRRTKTTLRQHGRAAVHAGRKAGGRAGRRRAGARDPRSPTGPGGARYGDRRPDAVSAGREGRGSPREERGRPPAVSHTGGCHKSPCSSRQRLRFTTASPAVAGGGAGARPALVTAQSGFRATRDGARGNAALAHAHARVGARRLRR